MAGRTTALPVVLNNVRIYRQKSSLVDFFGQAFFSYKIFNNPMLSLNIMILFAIFATPSFFKSWHHKCFVYRECTGITFMCLAPRSKLAFLM